MLIPTPVVPNYTHSIDIFALPEEHRNAARQYGLENEYQCFDYSDGDFYLLLNFSLLQDDQTPDEELQKFLDSGDEAKMSDEESVAYEDENYPVKDWTDSSARLSDYIGWLRALRYVQANVPAEFQGSSTLALRVWH